MTPLPDNLELGPVQLRVANAARTRDWLVDRLGMRTISDGDPAVGLGSAEARVWVRLVERPGASRVPRGGRIGLYHYALLLPSRADLGRFVAHLTAIGEPFGAADHLFSEAVYLTDPDGITVEVYADRPRETWRRHGDELLTAVDPLDVPGLVRSVGAGTWQGLPAGTRMGHVHLYIGGLAEAERFYVAGLGFVPATRALPGALFVAAGGYHHHVGLNTWAAHTRAAGPDDAGLEAWTLVLAREAWPALESRLAAIGVGFDRSSDALTCADPWGIRLRVVPA